jgi:Domain of unknown function (DUF4365)
VPLPRKQPTERKKRRTREHVIADLSANHVERHALLCGFSVRYSKHDYGIDLWIATYNRLGEIENGEIRVQLKATDHLKIISGGQWVVFPVERRDLRHWLLEPMPIILVVYDAAVDLAYWLYVQAYFKSQPGFDLTKAGPKVTVRIPRSNIVNQAAMKKFAGFRDAILAQTKGVVHHD